MKAQTSGTCTWCGKPYAAGADIRSGDPKKRTGNHVHRRCRQQIDQMRRDRRS